jgi:hypothetical protein
MIISDNSEHNYIAAVNQTRLKIIFFQCHIIIIIIIIIEYSLVQMVCKKYSARVQVDNVIYFFRPVINYIGLIGIINNIMDVYAHVQPIRYGRSLT